MKVWVCRDKFKTFNFGHVYRVFVGTCRPYLNCFSQKWECRCGERHIHDIGLDHHGYCPSMFKKMTGLGRHLRPGTKKLMEWTPPLAPLDGTA